MPFTVQEIPGCEEKMVFTFNRAEQKNSDVKEGDLFFALKGRRSDGHGFLEDVAKRGAKAAVVSKDYRGESFGLFLFRSEDVLKSLQDLGRMRLEEMKARVVGVTGSVGKTTVKEFIFTLLEKKFRVGKSFSSFNSQVTFPLNILNMNGDEEILVLEMGMSQKGEIRQLVSIAPPDVAVITKAALAHAQNFSEGLLGIIQAKMEIFSHEKTKMKIVNQQLKEQSQEDFSLTTSFSIKDRTADFFLSVSEGRVFVDEKGVRAAEVEVGFSEDHLLEDFLAAAAVVRTLGMSWQEILERVAFLRLPKMRFERFEKEGVLFINDAYNANPESMRAALQGLPKAKEGKKRIAVLGSMKELGDFSKSSHEEVGRKALECVDHILCLGQECESFVEIFQAAKKPAELFFEHSNLAKRLKELMEPGDVVLIKGSRSIELEKVLQYLDAVGV